MYVRAFALHSIVLVQVGCGFKRTCSHRTCSSFFFRISALTGRRVIRLSANVHTIIDCDVSTWSSMLSTIMLTATNDLASHCLILYVSPTFYAIFFYLLWSAARFHRDASFVPRARCSVRGPLDVPCVQTTIRLSTTYRLFVRVADRPIFVGRTTSQSTMSA